MKSQTKPYGSEADILDRLVHENSLIVHPKASSDWNLPLQVEPIYDFLTASDFAKNTKPKVNEHYYSSPPLDETIPKEVPKSPSTLSFTIKMKPTQKHSLQSDLHDLNKLRSNFLTSDGTCTSTSTSGFEDFKKTKDFGDFQVLSNSPEKRKKAPPVPFKPKGLKLPKMVDV